MRQPWDLGRTSAPLRGVGWMTDRYSWLGHSPTEKGVALIAQAPYHLSELRRLQAALQRREINAAIAVPIVPWKIFHRWRPTVRRVAETVFQSGQPLAGALAVDALLNRCSAVVVMNDWGVPRYLVERATARGIATFAWVEGVQDYEDLDTGLHRQAYQRVEHVFTLGEAAREHLGQDRATAIGSERLRDLWASPVGSIGNEVVINSNFTYGVQTAARKHWVNGAVAACQDNNLSWVLSRHIAERGRSHHSASTLDVAHLLMGANRLISRFSTVALDALVLGVELIYHNPHGEQEPTFGNPMGAFTVTRSVEELTTSLQTAPRPRADVRRSAEMFLRHHVLLDSPTPPAQMAADVMSQLLNE